MLQDERVQKIVDSLMVPGFRRGKLYEGIYAGSMAITDFLEKPENVIR